MVVYNGPHLVLTFEKEKNRFVNTWNSSPTSIKAFKNEMLEYLSTLEKINPSQILWFQEGFSFHIDDKTKLWVENHIMKKRLEADFISKSQDGFHHIAFIVGKDIIAHMEVMGMFNKKINGAFNAKHFATELEARKWLNNEYIINSQENEDEDESVEINYKGIDSQGKAVIEFKKNAAEITSTLNSFKNILDENNFMKNNVEKYSKLSLREKETLKFIIQGITNKQISEKMFVSPNTVRTHRNRIWKKLDIKHFRDCLKYECFIS
ncbi:helix-turn-helix transcriptional regulator [Vicingaceae bacterium]|nr:helix-turn-helix transcriptional regulator [Vicingaceae bacterium]